jgi:fumarylacetoacetase
LKELYWTPYQQLAHLGSAGEGLSIGDIFGTGTISSDVRTCLFLFLIFEPSKDNDLSIYQGSKVN